MTNAKGKSEHRLDRIAHDIDEKLAMLADRLEGDELRLLHGIVRNYEDVLAHKLASEKSLIKMMQELVAQRDEAIYWWQMKDEQAQMQVKQLMCERLSRDYGVNYFDTMRVVEWLLGQTVVVDDEIDGVVLELFEQMGIELEEANVIVDADLGDEEDIAS